MFVNFIWRIYVSRMLSFEIINFEEFILLGDVSLMICCYTLRENLCHWKLNRILSMNFEGVIYRWGFSALYVN